MAHTRTHGANARSQNWDNYEDERPQRGNWLPLDGLNEDELFSGTPKLKAMPAPRRMVFAPSPQEVDAPVAPTRAHPTRQRNQERVTINVPAAPAKGVQARAVAIVGSAALGALLLYVAATAFLEFAQVKLDDMQYGRPRTQQIDAYVGHNETQGMPSHFIAMNLNRRVTILQLPGGDSSKVTTIVGPYLFGQGEDLTPVQLAAQDLNADAKPDLIVTVKSEQLLYLNDGTAFRLATPEEQSAIVKAVQAKSTQPPAEAGMAPALPEAGK